MSYHPGNSIVGCDAEVIQSKILNLDFQIKSFGKKCNGLDR